MIGDHGPGGSGGAGRGAASPPSPPASSEVSYPIAGPAPTRDPAIVTRRVSPAACPRPPVARSQAAHSSTSKSAATVTSRARRLADPRRSLRATRIGEPADAAARSGRGGGARRERSEEHIAHERIPARPARGRRGSARD